MQQPGSGVHGTVALPVRGSRCNEQKPPAVHAQVLRTRSIDLSVKRSLQGVHFMYGMLMAAALWHVVPVRACMQPSLTCARCSGIVSQ